jgi:nucleotide-binding universal stress UspA family protein
VLRVTSADVPMPYAKTLEKAYLPQPEKIIEAAKKSQADLIVMGTRGMTELKSLFLGGVATKVVHHATCPVLLVR